MKAFLLKKLNLGNKKSLERLTEQNTGLIWSIVKKFLNRGYEKEDLYQIGSIGFIKAVKKFDINLGYKLSTIAVPYIMGEIKKFIRDDGIIKISRNIKELGVKVQVNSINEEIFENGREEKIEQLSSKVDEQSKIIDKISLERSIEKLGKRDKRIIKLRYFNCKTQSEVAKMLGISQVQVSRIEKRILNDMKEEMCG